MNVAIYATGPDSFITLPVVRWLKRPPGTKSGKNTFNQGIVAFVRTPDGEELPAREFDVFAIIVPDDQVEDADVRRIAAAAWRASHARA